MNITIGTFSFRIEILLLIAFLGWVLWGSVLCSCAKVNSWNEGFAIAFGDSGPAADVAAASPSSLPPVEMDTIPGSMGYSSPDEDMMFDTQPRVLSETPDNLNYFTDAGTQFSHACCPSTYSTDAGCACVK